MSFGIRALARDDWDEWRALWHGYLAFYETELPEAQFRRQFDRLTAPEAPRFAGFVAESDHNGLLGLAHCIWHDHGWTENPVLYLQDLFTTPDARGRGVGRSLIAAVYAHADRGKAANVYWLTQEFNRDARHLYDQVGQLTGFVKYERAR